MGLKQIPDVNSFVQPHRAASPGAYPRGASPSPRPATLRTTPFSFNGKMLLVLLVMLILLILPVIILEAALVYYQHSDRLFPGISSGPVAIGGLTRSQAETKINQYWNGERKLTASDGQRMWQVSPIEMGLWVNPQATMDRAYQSGRSGQGLQPVWELLNNTRTTVNPVVVFSPRVAQNGLDKLAQQVNQPAHNATIQMVDGQWVGIQGRNGLTLNSEETLKQVASHPDLVMMTGSFPLFTQTITPQVADPAPLLQHLNDVLAHPLRIKAYDPITDETIAWSVPPETFAQWLTVIDDGGQASFDLDASRLAPYLEEWKAEKLGSERTLEPFTTPDDLASLWQKNQPVKLLIHHLASTYTVKSGDTLTSIAQKVGMPYWKIQQANGGSNMNNLMPGQVLTIPSPNEMLPLPVVMGKRIVISISQQRLWTYENGKQRSESIISTGIASSPTMPGVYQIRTHEENAYASVWDLHMPNFMGIYEGWPGFMNGIHGLPTLSSGVQLWASVLGRPASYGCIILNMKDSEDLYNWAEEGVVVEIRP